MNISDLYKLDASSNLPLCLTVTSVLPLSVSLGKAKLPCYEKPRWQGTNVSSK